MCGEKDPKKKSYEFEIRFITYDHLSEAEHLGLREIIRRKMADLTMELDEAFAGKSFHLTQSHGDPGE